jgi:hypothetical protein
MHVLARLVLPVMLYIGVTSCSSDGVATASTDSSAKYGQSVPAADVANTLVEGLRIPVMLLLHEHGKEHPDSVVVAGLREMIVRGLVLVRGLGLDVHSLNGSALEVICELHHSREQVGLDKFENRQIAELAESVVLESVHEVNERIGRLQRELGGSGCKVHP